MKRLDGIESVVADLEARVQRAGERRVLIGIAGAPGAGKSTLAEALGERFPDAAVVPMDGFHLSNAELERLGLRNRKGAPDTFDGEGFVAAMRRVKADVGTVYLPRFDRSIEESIAASIAVRPEHRLVIVEGNYLLLEREPWNALDPLFDARFHVGIDDGIRIDRLIARHVAFGKEPDAARAWALGPDEANARLIAEAASRATARVRL